MTRVESTSHDADLFHAIYRAVGWTRIALLIHMLIVNALRIGEVAHPEWLIAIAVLMIAWTVAVTHLNQQPQRRTWLVMGTDLAIALLIVAVSRLVLGYDLLMDSHLGVAVYWTLAAPIVVAIWRGAKLGLVMGAVLSLALFLQAPGWTPRAWSDVMLMTALPYLVGVVVDQVNQTMKDRDRNFATAVALEERDRLNRIVHDGVLQVLAMVVREGNELGPRGKMLAVLARKQEDQLRATLQDKHVDVTQGGFLAEGMTDVVTMLEKHQNNIVTVSTMAGQVHMPTARAKDLDAAVTEVLSNVFKHAGVDARAWILLEEEGDQLIITVRDDGVGMTRQQLQSAADAGRMGVKESVIGRIIDLGGTSTLHSAPGEGTEWEFRVPNPT